MFRQSIIDRIDSDQKDILHQRLDQKVQLKIYTPNTICSFRHTTFSSKEPEILEWIDEYGSDGSFYDIGANIGIYSLYYAATKSGIVYSFEPSVFNLRQLAKNININNFSDKINIITNPLSNKTGLATFTNGNSDEGGALSAFGVDYGHDGKPILSNIKYKILGFSLDDLLTYQLIKEPPSLIKIDVDGIEHLILEGALNTISSNSCKSVFIEVNDDFKEQNSNVQRLLKSAGFIFKEKRQSDYLSSSQVFGETYNQIWIKP